MHHLCISLSLCTNAAATFSVVHVLRAAHAPTRQRCGEVLLPRSPPTLPSLTAHLVSSSPHRVFFNLPFLGRPFLDSCPAWPTLCLGALFHTLLILFIGYRGRFPVVPLWRPTDCSTAYLPCLPPPRPVAHAHRSTAVWVAVLCETPTCWCGVWTWWRSTSWPAQV